MIRIRVHRMTDLCRKNLAPLHVFEVGLYKPRIPKVPHVARGRNRRTARLYDSRDEKRESWPLNVNMLVTRGGLAL